MSQKRVVITGLGVVAPNGIGKDEFWENSLSARSFINPIDNFDAQDFVCQVGGRVVNFKAEDFVSPKIIKQTDRSTHFAIAACQLAAEDAGLNLEKQDPYQLGMCFANTFGGMEFAEPELYAQTFLGPRKVSAYQAIAWFYAAAQGQWSISKGIKGYGKSIVGDRAGGIQALIFGAMAIRQEHCKVAFAGGFDAPFVPYIYAIHQSSNLLARQKENQTKAYRPFDLNRSGMILGEGSGILILEEYEHALARGAKIYAEITGLAMNNDAANYASAATDGEQFSRCLANAVEAAEISPHEVDHIMAEGLATHREDYTEAIAINSVFSQMSEKTTVSAPKSMIGHSLAAAGAIDAIWACLMMENSVALPTANLENPDSNLGLNHVLNEAQKKEIKTTLCCGRGYGGINAAFVLKKNMTVEV
jgi:3-oxoacyl-(acyl-carrier-protein) synthase